MRRLILAGAVVLGIIAMHGLGTAGIASHALMPGADTTASPEPDTKTAHPAPANDNSMPTDDHGTGHPGLIGLCIAIVSAIAVGVVLMVRHLRRTSCVLPATRVVHGVTVRAAARASPPDLADLCVLRC